MEVSGKSLSDWEVCKPCRIEGTSTRADGFCEECEEYMCKKCFRYHLKSKGSRHHVLGSLRQGQAGSKENDQGTQPCQKHPNYKLRYYCRKHDKVACGDCIVAEHAGCKMEFIKDVAENFESTAEFSKAVETIKSFESEYKDSKQKQEMNRRDNSCITEKVLADIKRFRNELNEYLDNAEREIVMESKRLSQENDDLISGLETKMNQAKVQLDDLCATLDVNLYKGEILFIKFVDCKRLVSDVEQHVAEIKNKNNIKTFTFIPGERLVDLMASKVQLGTLNIAKLKSVETSSMKTQDITQSTERATGCSVLSKLETGDRPAFPIPTFKDPDPRARGFDVGKRVRHIGRVSRIPSLGTGTVTAVDPAGYVDVEWRKGVSGRYKAGAGGEYDIELV